MQKVPSLRHLGDLPSQRSAANSKMTKKEVKKAKRHQSKILKRKQQMAEEQASVQLALAAEILEA